MNHALRHQKPNSHIEKRHMPVAVRQSTAVSNIVQTKLTIGAPNDKYEQEADRVADQVMRMPANPQENVQRQADETDEELVNLSASGILSRKQTSTDSVTPSTSVGSQVNQLTGKTGSSMDKSTQSFMETRFGQSFDHVRIHNDQTANESSKAINAKAYTLNNHVAFAKGQYNPHSYEGKKLLAHELTHVIQQQTNTIRRACDCSVSGGRRASTTEHRYLTRYLPNLVHDNYCITHPRTKKYNCIAWTALDQSSWIWNQVDSVYGDNDGTVSIADFDNFYLLKMGYTATQAPSSNTRVALLANSSGPTHAAKVEVSPSCGTIPFSSKLGDKWVINHDLSEIEGGTTYGNAVRYYGI